VDEPIGRWELLFADVDAEFEALRHEEVAAETADRSRREFALIAFVDRLRAAVGVSLRVWLPEGEPIEGVVREVGPDWMLLAETDHREVLLPLAEVTGVRGLPGRTAVAGAEGAVAARLDLRYLLRRLARDRAPLLVTLRGGQVVSGTCDRVGRDFLEIAEHPPGEFRRQAAVGAVRSVPVAAVLAVRSVQSV
jgi:hypothetical protein